MNTIAGKGSKGLGNKGIRGEWLGSSEWHSESVKSATGTIE
jgi:hypothetical protein